jgi:hypothetical protein
MKYLLLFFIFLMLLPGTHQAQSLSEALWSRVNICYSNFEDMDEDGQPDFNKIDDARNGYLQISGSWPTCGCSCSATVGAYRNSQREYVILQSESASCSWEKSTTSNRNIRDILPEKFGIHHFSSELIEPRPDQPVFFLDVEIPRVGTDTRARLELVPFGLKPAGEGALCFEYREEESFSNCNFLYGILDIARKISSDETLNHILSGEFEQIPAKDRVVINEMIGSSSNQFATPAALQQSLIALKEIFDLYQSLDSLEIILGWDRTKSRFYIKEKIARPPKASFQEFLINNTYWSPAC